MRRTFSPASTNRSFSEWKNSVHLYHVLDYYPYTSHAFDLGIWFGPGMSVTFCAGPWSEGRAGFFDSSPGHMKSSIATSLSPFLCWIKKLQGLFRDSFISLEAELQPWYVRVSRSCSRARQQLTSSAEAIPLYYRPHTVGCLVHSYSTAQAGKMPIIPTFSSQ